MAEIPRNAQKARVPVCELLKDIQSNPVRGFLIIWSAACFCFCRLYLRIWEAVTGATLQTLRGHITGPIRSVAVSPDGELVASASRDCTVRL